MKKVLIMILCLAVCLSMFAGCGESAEKPSDTSAPAVATPEPAPVFILGLDDAFPPMGFRNDKNEIVGFDIDVANAVCDYLGWELKTQPIDWDSKEMELNSGTIDCIWNGMSWSQDRADAMTLSMPYMNNDMVYVVNTGDIADISELAGKKVGVQDGSTADETLRGAELASDIEILGYSTNELALFDLDLGGLDAVYMDIVSASYSIETSGKDMTMLTEGSASEQYVIGFRKDDTDLKDQVEKALIALEADGTLEEISIKWFSTNVVTLGK